MLRPIRRTTHCANDSWASKAPAAPPVAGSVIEDERSNAKRTSAYAKHRSVVVIDVVIVELDVDAVDVVVLSDVVVSVV